VKDPFSSNAGRKSFLQHAQDKALQSNREKTKEMKEALRVVGLAPSRVQ